MKYLEKVRKAFLFNKKKSKKTLFKTQKQTICSLPLDTHKMQKKTEYHYINVKNFTATQKNAILNEATQNNYQQLLAVKINRTLSYNVNNEGREKEEELK